VISPRASRAEAVRALRRAFDKAGIETAALDARVLVCAALGIGTAELLIQGEKPVGDSARTIQRFAQRRLAREPVARILGEREFWGLPFALSPETLVPRPDTETVVEAALALLANRDAPLRLLDLGTGSGCLLVALLHECPAAFGVGVDRSLGALQTARANAVRNGVGPRAAFVRGSWTQSLGGPFDLIVSNPPYIPSEGIATLEPEVREHDPLLALDGGPGGLDAYRAILVDARRLLVPGGHLVLEIGYAQADAVRQLAHAHTLEIVAMASDLSGNPRCVALKAT
jgi:release factor glutamine methyltransferase